MKTLRPVTMTIAVVAALATVSLVATAQQPPVGATSTAAAPAPANSVAGIPAVQLDYQGRRLATITRQGGKAVLTVENVDGGDPDPVAIPDDCQPSAIRWARRWDLLAVLTQCAVDSTHPQPTGAAWVLDVQAGKPLRKLVNFDGTGSKIQWRSDGKMVAFLYTAAPPAGSHARYATVIVAGPVDGGKLSQASPAGLDIHDFYLPPSGGGLLFTGTPLASPTAPPALYEASAEKMKVLFDPATATGPLHDLRIGRLRWSPTAAGRPMPVFFLGESASASQPGADLYIKLANDASPITNLTASQPDKPGWFEPSGTSALTTHVADGSTQLISYTALATGAGLRHSHSLCTIPGVITDGSGPGSIATNGGRYAYFERPKSGGPMTLNVGGWRVGMACKPRWSRPVGNPGGGA